MTSKYVYSPSYDINLSGIQWLHPFDGKKYSKAWQDLYGSIPNIASRWLQPKGVASDDYLRLCHTSEYLASLQTSKTISNVAEVSLLKILPASVLINKVLNPIKTATEGTRLAVEEALRSKCLVMNIGGGYHHAFSDRGEGFCYFADAALAINYARRHSLLSPVDDVMVIDLDAHRGNGFESFFPNDPHVHIFDMYNFQTYPGMHPGDVDDFPFFVPLRAGINGEEYLSVLNEELPAFIDSVKLPKLIIYNAGSDILLDDSLGGLNVEFSQVLERDRIIVDLIRSLGAPGIILTSGGYSKSSYQLVAGLAKILAG